jgi:hypothetical protein
MVRPTDTEVTVDKFDAMQMFVRVIEKGSFYAVAKERGIGALGEDFRALFPVQSATQLTLRTDIRPWRSASRQEIKH